MPRGPRLDCPGALHHLIVRGIERRRIFRSDHDRHSFLERLGTLVLESGAGLYAWALMPNHAHALVRTGALPLSRLAQRWLGPYATTFNRVHRRAGHLFQNRFKNVLVEEEPYLLELVRYIHLRRARSPLLTPRSQLVQVVPTSPKGSARKERERQGPSPKGRASRQGALRQGGGRG